MSVYKRGDTWWYSFDFGGNRIQESAKTKSKTVAKEAEQQRRRDLELGYNGITDKRDQRIRTFSNLAADYMEEYSIRNKRPVFARNCVRHLIEHLGDSMVTALSDTTVVGYQSTRLKEGLSPTTVNHEVGFLLRILGEMGDPIRLRLKRARKLKLPVRERIGRALTLPERDAIIATAQGLRSRHIYPAVLLSVEAGMRDCEIRDLQWGRVDLENRLLTVGVSKTEAGDGRTIPMSQAVHAALVGHARWFTGKFGGTDPAHYCFPFGSPQPTDPNRPVKSFKRAWYNVRKKAGIQARFHDGRHTFVTNLAEAGVSDEVIRSTVGHVSNHMLRHYSHIRTQAKHEAVAAVEALNSMRRAKAEAKRELEVLEKSSTLSTTMAPVQ